MDENNYMFFMATNCLRKDLLSGSDKKICLALSTIANLGSIDMCRDL